MSWKEWARTLVGVTFGVVLCLAVRCAWSEPLVVHGYSAADTEFTDWRIVSGLDFYAEAAESDPDGKLFRPPPAKIRPAIVAAWRVAGMEQDYLWVMFADGDVFGYLIEMERTNRGTLDYTGRLEMSAFLGNVYEAREKRGER